MPKFVAIARSTVAGTDLGGVSSGDCWLANSSKSLDFKGASLGVSRILNGFSDTSLPAFCSKTSAKQVADKPAKSHNDEYIHLSESTQTRHTVRFYQGG